MNDFPTLADFEYQTRQQVRWADCDMLGHVNNLMYFRYAEGGRVDYFDRLLPRDLLDGIWDRSGPVLADIQCSFLRSLHFPGDVDVGTRCVALGTKSVTLQSAIYSLDDPIKPAAVIRAVCVWMDLQENHSIAIPDVARAVFSPVQ